MQEAIQKQTIKELPPGLDQVLDITDRGVNYAVASAHHSLKERHQEMTLDSLLKESYETKLRATQHSGDTKRSKPAQMVDSTILLALAYPLSAEALDTLEERGKHRAQKVLEAKTMMVHFNHHLTDCLAYLSKDAVTSLIDKLAEENKFTRSKGIISKEQWEARLKGMSAEIAVRSALVDDARFSVRPASAEEDLQGSDIVINDNRGELSLDVKNNKTFTRNLKDRGLSDLELDEAVNKGYFIENTRFIEGIYYGQALVDADHSGVVRGTRYASGGDENCRSHVEELMNEIIASNKLSRSQNIAHAAVRNHIY